MPNDNSQMNSGIVATPCSVLGAGLSVTQIKAYLPVCISKGVK